MLKILPPDNATHYDSITDAWRHIFGESFHFGYFSSSSTSLDEATDALIDKMASFGDIKERSRVLDVGCGIGQPAFHLHKRYGCSIIGISTSQKGIEQAQKESDARGYRDNVRFQVADGLDNGFPADSFDVVWVMESSHLMKNKRRLFEECYRVLKKNGVLLLCDVMLKRPISVAVRLSYLARLGLNYIESTFAAQRAFGRVKLMTFDYYINTIRASGFNHICFIDISMETLPTLKIWKSNIENKKRDILESFTAKEIEDFVSGTTLLEDFGSRGIHGYGLIRALKA